MEEGISVRGQDLDRKNTNQEKNVCKHWFVQRKREHCRTVDLYIRHKKPWPGTLCVPDVRSLFTEQTIECKIMLRTISTLDFLPNGLNHH